MTSHHGSFKKAKVCKWKLISECLPFPAPFTSQMRKSFVPVASFACQKTVSEEFAMRDEEIFMVFTVVRWGKVGESRKSVDFLIENSWVLRENVENFWASFSVSAQRNFWSTFSATVDLDLRENVNNLKCCKICWNFLDWSNQVQAKTFNQNFLHL